MAFAQPVHDSSSFSADLLVCSRVDASRVLHSDDVGPRVHSMISIGDPSESRPSGTYEPNEILRLEFHDTVVIDDPFGPKAEHVERIVEFASKANDLGGVCLVHCAAGISRSTATGIILLSTVAGPGSEVWAAERVLALVPCAMPNPRLLSLADRILGREGALREAVDKTFPLPICFP